MQTRSLLVTGTSDNNSSKVAAGVNSATVVYLALAGILLLAIGGAILLAPHAFHGSNGIELGNNPTLLSEVRAPGGLLFGCAILAIVSVFRPSLRTFSTRLLVLVYGSFGMARLASIAIDGMPASSIVGAMVLELVVAAVGVAVVWQQTNRFETKLAISDAAR